MPGAVADSDIRQFLKRMPYTVRVGDAPGGLSEFVSLQAAIDYAWSQGPTVGNQWTVQTWSGTFDAENLTLRDYVNLKAMGTPGSVRIIRSDAANPIVSSGVVCEIDGFTIQNTNAGAPAVRVTAGDLILRNCTILGTGAGDAIQMTGGGLTIIDSFKGAGDIDLSTAPCALVIYRSRLTTDGIDTAGAFAHAITLENCDLGGQNIASAATGATTLALRNCANVGTVSNAGTGTFTIRGESDVDTVSVTNAAGSITCYEGTILHWGGTTGTILWYQTTGLMWVLPRGVLDNINIQAAINALPGNGGTVHLSPGNFYTSATINSSNGCILEGSSMQGTRIYPQAQTFAAITVTGAKVEWRIANLAVDYGASAANPAAIGIQLVENPPGSYPYQFSIENVTLLYCYRGFVSPDLPFMFSLKNVNVYAQFNIGVVIGTGTTVSLTNVYVNGGGVGIGGFRIIGVNGLVMTNCAVDNCVAGASSVCLIQACRFVINGYFTEGNAITTGALVTFSGSRGKLTSYISTGNTLSPGAGLEAWGIKVGDASEVVIIGPRITEDISAGAAGSATYELQGDAGNSIFITMHQVDAAVGGAGTNYGIYTATGTLAIGVPATLTSIQTLTNKTLTAPIAATIGPSAAQQHTLPVVASDTVALLAANQTLAAKTLTSPTINTPSIVTPAITGITTESTYSKQLVIQKTGIADNVATSFLRVTTVDEVGNVDGGGWALRLLVLAQAMLSAGSFDGNAYIGEYLIVRAMNGVGAGVTSAVTSVATAGPVATGGGTNVIVSVAVTTVEVSEFVVDIQVTINYGWPEEPTIARVIAKAELVWDIFATTPTMAAV